jgi:histidyl-tRNA synthetase
MREFGFEPSDVRVRLSDRRLLAGILGSLGLGGEREGLAHQALDKLGRSEYGTRKQALLEAAASPEAIAGLESLRELRDLDAVERRFRDAETVVLRGVLGALEAAGLAEFVDLDLTIVRGLAYYTGTVFELFDAKKSLRAICGGGRYDNLLESLGGVDLPALGFGMGDVVLGELIKERGLVRPYENSIDVFVAGVTSDDHSYVLALAHELRDAGLRVEYGLSEQTVKKQLALADARKARVAIVIGPDDRARGEVMVKDLKTNSQQSVARDAVGAHVLGVARQLRESSQV